MKRSTTPVCSRTTLVLLALTIGLGAWMILRRGGNSDTAENQLLFDWSGRTSAEKGKVDVDVDIAGVAGVDLKSSSVELSLRRTPDGPWELTRGLIDRADERVVKSLLNYIGKAQIKAVIARNEVEDGKVSPASLGLDDANVWRLAWLKADGSVLAEIKAGKSAPLDNAGYIEMLAQPRRGDVYVVSPDLRPLLARPLDSFRDPRISRYQSAEVQRLIVRKGEGEVEFSRASVKEADHAPWVISRPLPNAPADQPAVIDFVAMICGAKVKGWIPWTEGSGDGVEKPVVEATIIPAGDGAKGTTLSFFLDPESPDKTAICRDRQRKARMKVDKQLMDDLCLADSPANFRSRRLAAIDPGFVSTIKIESTIGESMLIVRVRKQWSWRPLNGGEWKDAAPEEVDRLVNLLNDTEIIDFASDSLADPAAFALDKPAVSVTMGAGAHVSLDELTPLTPKNSQVLRIGIRAADNRIFANFAGDPFVYLIGPELPSGIPQTALKWRKRDLLLLSPRQFRTVVQTIAASPPVTLSCDQVTLQWKGEREGKDVTAALNPAAINALVNRLGALTVASWLKDTVAGSKALEQPAVSIQLRYEDLDDKPGTVNTVVIELASMAAGRETPLCYGRLNRDGDIFLIESAIMHELAAPLVR